MEQLGLVVPFVGVLLSFAVLPGLAPRLWHRRMAVIIAAWVALDFALQAMSTDLVQRDAGALAGHVR